MLLRHSFPTSGTKDIFLSQQIELPTKASAQRPGETYAFLYNALHQIWKPSFGSLSLPLTVFASLLKLKLFQHCWLSGNQFAKESELL